MRSDRRSLLVAGLSLSGAWTTRGSAGSQASVAAKPTEPIALWPYGAPGMPDPAPSERITERSTDPSFKDRAVAAVAEPRLVVFHPAHASGASVLLMPGGGYRHVVVDKEGYEMGRWLAARGRRPVPPPDTI